MFKIERLDKLTRQLAEAEQAIASIDGDIGTVNFNPQDPASIEQAIQAVEALVDEKLKAYSGNPLIESLAQQIKEQLRQGIIDKAAEATVGDAEEP